MDPADPPKPINSGPIQVEPPRREDLQPSYARIVEEETDPGWYGRMRHRLGHVVGFCGALPCIGACCPNPYREIQQGSVGLVTRFGRFVRAADPGLVRVNVGSERLHNITVKIQILEVPRQSVMTRDNVSLLLSSVLFFKIISPHKAVFGVSDIRLALLERTQTTLRNVVGARMLQDVVERREEIANDIRTIIEEVSTTAWGVDVESMLIKDLVFSQELQESLSMAAQAKRTGEAKIIAARAEVEAAKQMRRAADILSSAPAMQIRYLEAMQSMAKTAGSKVIFLPAPNQTVQEAMVEADRHGEGPKAYGSAKGKVEEDESFVGDSFRHAITATNVERA